jgi:hypothetical protein
MALFNALMRFKDEGRLRSFDMHGDKKATAHLLCGQSVVIYMSTDYIIGAAEIREAAEAPRAEYVIYNNWDKVSSSAYEEARDLGIQVHKFGAFGYRLDELNRGT